jgi:hypothetical protein
MANDKEYNEIKYELHISQANLNYMLEAFGNTVAKREGYKDLDGMEAIYFYLITKYSWLPNQVRALSTDDIRLVLSQEMHGWTLPKPLHTKMH